MHSLTFNTSKYLLLPRNHKSSLLSLTKKCQLNCSVASRLFHSNQLSNAQSNRKSYHHTHNNSNHHSSNHKNSSNSAGYSKASKSLAFAGSGIVVYLAFKSIDSSRQFCDSLTSDSNFPKLSNAFASVHIVELFGYRIPVATLTIMLANTAVFLAWRFVPQPFMYQYFTTSFLAVFKEKRWYTVLTAAFSHESLPHFLFNNFAFFSCAPILNQILGDERFSLFYLSSAITSTLIGFMLDGIFALNQSQRLYHWARPSLGASGAVFACFAIFTQLFPDSKWRIMFIPYDISGSSLLPGLVAFDGGGLIYNMMRGPSPLGHGAHIGGVLTGLTYYKYLQRTDPIVQSVIRRQQQQEAFFRK
jgi:membrane associated rhomboid family serine protease